MTRRAVPRTPRPVEEASLWQACAAGLDLVAPTADVVAVTPVGSYLAWRLRAAVAHERLFLHASEPDAQGMLHPGEAEPVILPGEHEHDRVTLPSGLWPHPPSPAQARVRPLDLLYADSHKVGLLILDAGDGAAGILRGAARVLAEHAPLLLIDCNGATPADRPRLWRACVAAASGYHWSNGPCRGETVAHGIPASRGVARCSPAVRSPALRVVAARWRDRLRRTGADPIPSVTLKFDGALCATGMYPAERDSNGRWWRRTGPRVAFYLPLPVPGLWRLRFQVAHWGAVKSPAELRLYAGGVRLRQTSADPDGIGFEPFNVLPQRSEALLIELITPVAAAGASGVGLAQCIAEPAEP